MQQKQLIITSCVVFCLAYLARCLIEFLYFGRMNAQVAMQGDPNYWHWLTWPGLVTDCLPIVIMALMHLGAAQDQGVAGGIHVDGLLVAVAR